MIVSREKTLMMVNKWKTNDACFVHKTLCVLLSNVIFNPETSTWLLIKNRERNYLGGGGGGGGGGTKLGQETVVFFIWQFANILIN